MRGVRTEGAINLMIGLNNPLALLGLLLLPAMYLLYTRMRREPIRVPSVLIWKRVGRVSDGARGAERRADIRLFFYLAAVLAGLLAVSRPVIRHESTRISLPQDTTSVSEAVSVAEGEVQSVVILVSGVRDRRLERALSAIPHTKVRNIWGEPPGNGPAVMVAAACDRLPEGNVAVINPRKRAGPITIEGKRPAGKLVVEDPDHPLLEGVDVKRMDVKEVLVGSFPDELKVLISADGMPVVAVMPKAGGSLLYLGFDMSASQWHAYPSFPIFWYNFFGRENKVQADFTADRKGINPRSSLESRETNLSWLFLILMLAAIAGLWLSADRA